MPNFAIHLALSDSALRQAVAEQLKLAQFAVSGETEAGALPPDADALIVDEASPALEKWRAAKPNGCVLRLGDETADGIATESLGLPLRLGHLLARLRYHLEVAPRLRGATLAFGPYIFEPQNRQLTVADTGAVIRLTEKESSLLEYIASSPQPATREDILAAIWGYDGRIDTHTLETHIYQLRRKLETDPRGAGLLRNEQGAYRLDGRDASA